MKNKINVKATIEDVAAAIDKVPATITLTVGLIIGAMIPFKFVIFVCSVAAIWFGIKKLEV